MAASVHPVGAALAASVHPVGAASAANALRNLVPGAKRGMRLQWFRNSNRGQGRSHNGPVQAAMVSGEMAQCRAMNASWPGMTSTHLPITLRTPSRNSAIFASGYTSTNGW